MLRLLVGLGVAPDTGGLVPDNELAKAADFYIINAAFNYFSPFSSGCGGTGGGTVVGPGGGGIALNLMEQGIPVIAVRENKNRMQNSLEDYPFQPGKLFIVDNYLETVGVMNALKAGVSVESIRRPLADTRVVHSSDQNVQPQKEVVAEESSKVVMLHREKG